MHDPLDMVVGSALAQVVELIITQYEWFFQNDASLPWDHLLPSTHLGLYQPPPTTSPGPTNREKKGKGKKAPPPPSNSIAMSSPPALPPPNFHEGGKQKTASQPPSHAPPSPPNSSLPPTQSLYQALTIPAPRSGKTAVPTKQEGITRQERTAKEKESTHL